MEYVLKFQKVIASLLTTAALSACGGGSDSSNNDVVDSTAPADTVVDLLEGAFSASSLVSGLSYSTETHNGVTDASGTFYYKAGETITFSIGSTVIGEAVAAKSELTAFDLIPDAVLYTNSGQFNYIFSGGYMRLDVDSLSKFSNILTFLQVLDSDANPDNGIDIPSGMASYFEGIKMNFSNSLFDFHGAMQPRLAIILNQATNSGLLSSGEIIGFGKALDDYYRLHGISHELSVMASYSTQNYRGSGDKSPDTSIYTYDASGNRITDSTDRGSDGTVDEITTYTYDTNGTPLTLSYDYDADGIVDFIDTAHWHVHAIQITSSSSVYICEDSDNQLTYCYDIDGDGNTNATLTITYDTNGYPITFSFDTDADGTADRVDTMTNDANGKQLTYNASSFVYNDSGKLLKYSVPRDGLESYTHVYTYDDSGNQLTAGSESEGGDAMTYIYYTPSGKHGMYVSNNAYGSYYEYCTYDASGNRLTHSAGKYFYYPNYDYTDFDYSAYGYTDYDYTDTYTYTPTTWSGFLRYLPWYTRLPHG